MGGLEDKCHWLLSPDEQMRAKWARLGDVGGGWRGGQRLCSTAPG